MNTKPSNPNSEPQAPDPEPRTSDPGPRTPDPEPRTPDPGPRTLNPDLSAPSGWEPIVLPPVLVETASYVSGDPEGDGLRVRYYHHPDETFILARVWFGPRTAGPPGHAHGGSISAVLDEAMGVAALFSGRVAVAGRIVVDFLRMLPLKQIVTIRARVERVEGSKVFTSAELTISDEQACARSEGIFIDVGMDRMLQLLAP